MKKFFAFLSFVLIISAFVFVGGIERGTFDFQRGICAAVLCIAGSGVFSKLSGLWYEV